MNRLLSAKDVGDALGVKPATARRYMRDMATVPLPGGDIRVEEDELARWINSRRKAPPTDQPKPKKTRVTRTYDLDLFEPDGRIKRRRHT